jgi:putative transposase
MNFRRYYVPDAIVFITQIVQDRMPIFRNETHLDLLRSTLHQVKTLHPFSMLGYVFLPDHFHLLIKLTGSSNFSQIMHSLKPNFTKAYKHSMGFAGKMKFWQRRFWDHVVRDEMDLARHLDYIHYNPVKHRLVTKPEDWRHSSFLEWKKRGAYPDGWGWSIPQSLVEFDGVVGE